MHTNEIFDRWKPDGPVVPVVDYLSLDGDPHLVAYECTACSARFFDRRNACGACGRQGFRRVPLPPHGVLRTFTVVHVAAPGVPVPFVTGIVDCGGTHVCSTLFGFDETHSDLRVGLEMDLVTYVAATDASGVDALAFGFVPAANDRVGSR